MEESKQRANVFFRLVEFALIAFFDFTKLLSYVLPPSVLYALFNAAGYLLFLARPGMREHLTETLRDALPEIEDEQELEKIAMRASSALFHPMLDMVVFKRHRERMMCELTVEGMEHLDAADAMGKGVILFTPHLGSLSIITAVFTHLGKNFTPLVLPPWDSPVPRYISAMTFYAHSLGCDRECPAFWTGRDAIGKVVQHLAKGKRVGISYDVEGDFVTEFFGRPTAIASGIARFAQGTGAPIVPTSLLRQKDPFKRHLKLYPALTYELSGDRESDVKTILDAVIRSGEGMIREAPWQWMGWFGLRQWRKKAEEMAKKRESSG